MVAQQLLHQVGLSLLQRHVVRVSAKDVLELTLQLVYILIMFTPKLELHLFILYLSSFFLLRPLIEILAKVFNYPVVMMPMLLPVLTQLVGIGLGDLQHRFSHLESLIN